jgi:glycerophosphoryl diester phosphodiesterase
MTGAKLIQIIQLNKLNHSKNHVIMQSFMLLFLNRRILSSNQPLTMTYEGNQWRHKITGAGIKETKKMNKGSYKNPKQDKYIFTDY